MEIVTDTNNKDMKFHCRATLQFPFMSSVFAQVVNRHQLEVRQVIIADPSIATSFS